MKNLNIKRQIKIASISLMPSMIFFTILSVASSTFEYYLAQPSQKALSFTIIPISDEILLYNAPSFFDCSKPANSNCISLLNDVELTVEWENFYWYKIIDCKSRTGNSPCEQAKNKYVFSGLFVAENSSSFISSESYNPNKSWIDNEIRDWKATIAQLVSQASEASPEFKEFIGRRTIQDIQAMSDLMSTNQKLIDIPPDGWRTLGTFDSSSAIEPFKKVPRQQLKEIANMTIDQLEFVRKNEALANWTLTTTANTTNTVKKQVFELIQRLPESSYQFLRNFKLLVSKAPL